MRKLPVSVVLITLSVFLPGFSALAQTGGDNAYEFLNMPASARMAAMGTNFLAVRDNDVNLAIANPSVISPLMNNRIGLNFVDYYTDISYGMVTYSRSFEKLGSFATGLNFINYGKFAYADDQGTTSGDFTGGEYAFSLGWGRVLDTVFSIGANVRGIYSSLESYNSGGIAVDVAGSYIPSEYFCYSLIFRNIGRQLKGYTPAGVEPLPFEIQLAMTNRFQHLPFRYSIVLQHLEKWDLTYNTSDDTDPVTGQTISRSKLGTFSDKALRHIVIGGEFLPAKMLAIRLGYNYQRRQEMKVASRAGTVGFSWGFGININRFSFNYARAAYHLVGSPNYISVTMNLGKN